MTIQEWLDINTVKGLDDLAPTPIDLIDSYKLI